MGSPVYEERVTSKRTTALFLGLALVFSLVFIARQRAGGLGVLGVASLCLAILFLFYFFSYRVLAITITTVALRLRYGVFRWTVALEDIAGAQVDALPPLLRYGGAGIHFMTVRGRYRACFNVLEGPRVVVALKKRRGWVRDLSFSTRHPDVVLRNLEAALDAARPPNERRSDASGPSDAGDA